MLIFTGCGRRAATSITAAGSTAFQPFAEKLAEQFMTKHTDVSVMVQGGGSAVGIRSAIDGTAQIGMADMVTLPADAKGLVSTTVARDGIALVVNPANRASELTTEQVRGIFNGTINNWKAVGGDDRKITVVSRESGSGTRSSFEQIVGGLELSKEAIVQDSNGTIRETVANDPNAIGYVSHGLVNNKIKPLRIDGVECVEKEIVAGKYKLVRPIFLLTKGAPSGAVKDFIDYVLSSEGQDTIKKDGLLPAR
jgi:phosphate transport system substrate-binding protein